jgi:hypothetical protein
MLRPVVVGAAIFAGCGLLFTTFWVGRLSMGRVGVSTAGSDTTDLRQDVAELRAVTERIDHSLARLSERVGSASLSATATGVAPPASCQCPTAAKVDDPALRAEAERAHPVMQEAEALVGASIIHGTWTERDIVRFRELSREASDLNWVPLMQKVDQAINEGRLRPDPDLVEFH